MTTEARIALAGVCALAVSWVLTALLIRWAPQLRLVDYPDPRKVHTRPTPRAGGLAIYGACVLTAGLLWAFDGWADRFGWGVLLMGLGIVVLGLIDDLRPLPWQLRLGVQAVAAVIAVLWLLPPTDLLQRGMAVFWVVGLINAFNMLDNMDALSSGVAWVAAGYLAVLTSLGAGSSESREWLLYLVLMGSITGFLIWNWPPAHIFMGDCGSTFLGLVVGLGTARIALSPLSPAAASPEVPLWARIVAGWGMATAVAGAAWYDLITVVSIRLSQGRSPFHPDKQHLSHRLVGRGLSSPFAVRLIHLMALASGASGLILCFVPSLAAAAVTLGQCLAWWLALAGIEFLGKRTNDNPSDRKG
jgi:UDP-GlcNAc:undecaprenyl-phosphate GlcNAc-1-phosphate transferase